MRWFVNRVALLSCLGAGSLAAQAPEATVRLRQELPALADRLEPVVRGAEEDGLPAGALVSRALEGRAKGVPDDRIVSAVSAYAVQLGSARDALAGSGRAVRAGEIEAGALAIGLGARQSDLSELARAAPSGRSLAVPLAVMGALVARGLPSDAALERVQASLAGKGSDRELLQLPASAGGAAGANAGGGPPPWAGPGATANPPSGPPPGVPGNAGGVDPGQRGKPEGTPGRR